MSDARLRRPQGRAFGNAVVPHSFGFLSTYPPTQCGIATFCHALMASMATAATGDHIGVVRVMDSFDGPSGPEVAGELRTHVPGTHIAAAAVLNTFDVAVVQHEYGIYGGQDGDQLLAVLDHVRVPVVVVAHTVLARPTPHQDLILRRVVAACDAVVVMTDAASERLVRLYGVDPAKVRVIRHGATARAVSDVPTGRRNPLILTWGLLGPGKGIEWGIDGLRRLRRLLPLPTYVVAGQTHPRVRQQQGEEYRHQLHMRAKAAGVADMLKFESSYVDEDTLGRLIWRADVVLLPYDSREQVTSGVLGEAVAAGKPVVATAFPHAVELLSSGAGLLVPQQDGAAMGEALYRVLTEPGQAQRMRTEAERIAPTLRWSTVADQYRALAIGLLVEPTSALGRSRQRDGGSVRHGGA
jgi:glycosyltransferase involved in cell wall biosynthesis